MERLWKNVKYEKVYLHAYDTVSAAKQGSAHYVTVDIQRRLHSALGQKTPDKFYYEQQPKRQQAA